MAKRKFYAYLTEEGKGIVDNWEECKEIVSGVPGAKYKGFLTEEEAERWLEAGADYNVKHIASEKGVYFDSGTGAGQGVEINVTDEKGRGLLDKILPKAHINGSNHHWIFKDVTNNFGELLACKYALQIAMKEGVKKVFGDSDLIIRFWSKGLVNRRDKPVETIKLIDEVAKLRGEFEKTGGKIEYIPGASNPADLGFHKD